MSKDEKIIAKKAELNVLLLQLKELGNPATTSMVAHINQALNEGQRIIDDTLKHMPIEVLRKLQSHLGQTNHEQMRIDFLSRYIFVQDFASIENMNAAMQLSEAAIKCITIVKFYENYLDKDGRLSWDNYKESIEQALQS